MSAFVPAGLLAVPLSFDETLISAYGRRRDDSSAAALGDHAHQLQPLHHSVRWNVSCTLARQLSSLSRGSKIRNETSKSDIVALQWHNVYIIIGLLNMHEVPLWEKR